MPHPPQQQMYYPQSQASWPQQQAPYPQQAISPQMAPAPWGNQPVPAPVSSPPHSGKARSGVGFVLVLLGIVGSAVGFFCPWYRNYTWEPMDGGGIGMVPADWRNGWQHIQALMGFNPVMGLLMYLSLGLAVLGAVLAIAGAARCLAKGGRGAKAAAVIGSVVGLVAAGAVAPGFYFFNSGDMTNWATWLYGFAFALCLVGAVLLKTRRYPAQPVPMQPGFAQPFTAQPNGYR